jgi:hypothetical protein
MEESCKTCHNLRRWKLYASLLKTDFLQCSDPSGIKKLKRLKMQIIFNTMHLNSCLINRFHMCALCFVMNLLQLFFCIMNVLNAVVSLDLE